MKRNPLLFLVVFVAALATRQPLGRDMYLLASEPEKDSTAILRWKFVPNEVIRYKLHGTESVSIANRSYRNEIDYTFRWTVLKLGTEGRAVIRLDLERLVIDRQWPTVHFDSADDRLGVKPSIDSSIRPIYYKYRALAASVMVIGVMPSGSVFSVAGLDSPDVAIMARQMLPADFPALPDKPPAVDLKWTVPTCLGPDSGEASYAIRDVRLVDGVTLADIGGVITWKPNPQLQPNLVHLPNHYIEAEFDCTNGKLRSQRMHTDVLNGKTNQGQPFKLKVEASLDLLPSVESSWHPPQPASTIELSNGSRLFIVTHSGFEDKNINGIPDRLDEIRKASRQFFEGETISITVFAEGLKDKPLRFDLVDATGNTLRSIDIALRNELTVAHRELRKPSDGRTLLVPGIYFLEWWCDGSPVYFAPLQIYDPQVGQHDPNATAHHESDRGSP